VSDEEPQRITIAPAYGVDWADPGGDNSYIASMFSAIDADYLDELLKARGWHRARERATWARAGLAVGKL